MNAPVAAPYQEPRPWKRSDIACALFALMVLYALSPPWVIAISRGLHAPAMVMNVIAFGYHPLSVMRQTYPPVDYFYSAYRLLLSPYLSGI